jgi:phosphopantetheine--protein transferase-like protein
MNSDNCRIYLAVRRVDGCSSALLLERLKDCEQNRSYIEGLDAGINSTVRLGALQLLLDLAEYVGCDLKSLSLIRQSKGKPYFEGEGKIPFFSLSHTENVSAVALSLDADVGVDAERVDKYNGERMDKIAERFFSEAEQAIYYASADKRISFFEIWTRKEAMSKLFATGEPYLYDTVTDDVRFSSSEVDGTVISVCCSANCSQELVRMDLNK